MAHSAGWAMGIPLQNRVRNGIVYAVDFYRNDGTPAVLLGISRARLLPTRQIRFTPVAAKKPGYNNCIAIGLSSGFLEPLRVPPVFTYSLQITFDEVVFL